MLQSAELRPLVSGLGRILLIAVIGHIAIRLGAAVINRVWGSYESHAKDPRRVKTMAVLLRSILRYSVDFIAFVSILDVLEINTGSVLAGAGILGLAIGFGAQNFVKDLIAGFFIVFEDQFGVGEFVTIAGITGTVEEVGLRVTKLRSAGGELHVIPNGIIDRSANMSRGSMLASVDIPVSPEEKISRVTEILTRVVAQIKSTEPSLAEGPDVLGPVAINELAITFRIIARTQPQKQWAVERKIRSAVKEAFEVEGIQLPSPMYRRG